MRCDFSLIKDYTVWVYIAEILRGFVSDIVIVRHPVSACVPVNHTLTLSVRAESTGILSFQWFTDDEKVVSEVCA